MSDFRMPSLGADMDAGTLVEWKIKPGDKVKRGDIVALVETQKGIVEIEIWESGVIEATLVEPGSKVSVGTVLATLATEGETLRPPPRAQAAPMIASPPAQPPVKLDTATISTASGARIPASPAARQLARERGIDLAGVHGTGPHGTITRGDVEHAASLLSSNAPSPSTDTAPATDTTAMRHAIATAMARSKREIPHYYLAADIDVDITLRWLEQENSKRPITERILFAALLLKATALAVREVPDVNGFYVDGEFRQSNAVHVGVAVMLRQGGLVAPALHDVDQKPVGQVMSDLRDLVGRARRGILRSSEMADPTITVTNLGEQGVTTVFGVIYPPQVALVGFGKVVERPWAEKGMLGVRPVVTATLAADHRVTDGHRGALFLAAIDRLLSQPEKL